VTTVVERLRAELMAREPGKDAAFQGVDSRNLREYNHLLVLNSVRLQGPLARVAIAQQTGLSKTTVSTIIDQLLQDGLVSEGDFIDAAATGGRRPILVHFNNDTALIMGIEITYSALTLVTTNLGGEVRSVYTEPFDLTSSPANSLAMLGAAVRIFMAKSNLTWEQILGIGLGIAAPLDSRTHMLMYPPGDYSWEGIDLVASLTNLFGVPVYVDNNANLAALSEGRYGVAKDYRDFAYIYIGQGIGCGLIHDQQIYHGMMGGAGELGHLHIADSGPQCICGKVGCLETLADNDAIVDDASLGRSLARIAPRARVNPQLADRDDIDINDVLHAADAGDLGARLALQTAGRAIGTAVGTLITMLNPEVVILDGPTVRMGRYLLDAVQEEAARQAMPANWAATRIITGQLGDLAVPLGAATLVINAAFALSSVISEAPTMNGATG
jgi:predicted NBD/HSP70 family sugar kinase